MSRLCVNCSPEEAKEFDLHIAELDRQIKRNHEKALQQSELADRFFKF